MTQPAGIDLQLNAQQYLQGSVSVLQQTGQMEQSLTRLSVATNVLNRSLDGASFSKKHSAALGTFAASAAVSQQQLSGLSATAAITGQSTNKLGTGIRALARDFPTGTQTALDTVSAINQLGIASKGSEAKVLSLSKTMIQLQGAAGGYAADYAPGMLQLERTFGDQGVDPKKVQATSDALVSVSKNVGASVQGTLAFSNAIGPVAQSAGIGKLATLGIGAAMNSIGQDGTRAGTAINKMLSDMSSAVRDGGPQMNTYADIVGMTADNFKTMYKNNPAAAIEEVTTAIGKAGQQGPRILQNLGLDGVTTFRSLQALSSSGTLTNAINTSIAAGSGGGNGATAKASGAAFSGVLDKFSEVSTSAGQVAQALGRPMLGALGIFASALSGVSKRAASLMDNRWVKDAINVVGGLMVARRVFGLGLTGALVKQGVTSGPVLSGLAGYRAGMGQTLDERGRYAGFLGRSSGAIQSAEEQLAVDAQGNPIIGRNGQQSTRLRQGAMGGIRGRIYDFGLGWGQNKAARLAAAQAEDITQEGNYLLRTHGPMSPEYAAFAARQANGPQPIERAPLRTRVRRMATTAGRAYMAVNQATIDAASTPVMGRDPGLAARFLGGKTRAETVSEALRVTRGTAGEAAGAVGSLLTSPFRKGSNWSDEATKARDSLRTFNREVTGSSGTLRSFGASMASLGRSSGVFGAQAAGSAVRGTVGALGGMASGLMGSLLSPQMLLMGGMAVGGMWMNKSKQSAQQAQAESDRQDAMTPTGTLDAYNEALGKAAQSTQTFAQQMASNTKLTNTAVKSFADALTVSAADQTGAADGKNVVNYDTNATNSQVESRIRQMSVSGMAPDQLQVVKGDLIRQFGAGRAQQILGQLGPSAQQGTNATVATGSDNPQDIANLVNEAALQGLNVPEGMRNPLGTANLGGGGNQITAGNYYGFGSSTGKVTLKKGATDINDQLLQNIQQRYMAQSDYYGAGYAKQVQAGDINQAMAQAAASGNEAETNQLGDELAKQFGLGGKNQPKIPRITSDDIKRYGSYTAALAAKSPAMRAYLKSSGLDANGQGSATATPQLNATAQRFTGADLGQQNANALMPFFDNTMTGNFTGTGSPNLPASMRGKMTDPGVINAVPGGLEGLPGGWAKINARQVQSSPSAAVFAANQAMQASLLAPDNTQLSNRAVDQTVSSSMNAGTSLKSLATSISQMASSIDDDASPAFQRLIAMSGRLNEVAQAAAPFQSAGTQTATLGTQALANVNVTGTSQGAQQLRDTGKAQGQQFEQDYANQVKGMLAAERQYQVQSSRGQYDFQVQSFNAYEDYLRQLGTAERDYNIQSQRATADYNHTRLLAIRDFNKQIAREVADSAASLYDPYKRIQTQATWDVQSLLANMAEQNQAVVKQNQQLAALRKAGLTEQTIEQLKLNDPANAQQLNQLSGDVTNKPGEIAQLNAASATSMKNASTLVNDPSNKQLARAKADFQTQLNDMKYTFDLTAKRAREDIQRSTGDMAHDYGVMMSRAATSYGTALTRMRQDTTEAESEMVMSTAQMWSAAQDLIAGKYVDTNKFMQNSLGTTVQWLKDNNLGDAIADSIGMSKNFGGMTITVTPGQGSSVPGDAAGGMGSSAAGSMALTAGASSGDGGIFTSPQLRYIGERGAEAVLPLSGQGISMLAEAFSRAQISHAQLNRMNTAGRSTPVQYVQHSEHHVSDHSTNYAGANFIVQAQDPDMMQRKLEAKKRASNLVPSGKRQHP